MTTFDTATPAKFIVCFRRFKMSQSIGVHTARAAVNKMIEIANGRAGHLYVIDREGRSYDMEELAALAQLDEKAAA